RVFLRSFLRPYCRSALLFFLFIVPPPPTSTLFPYTTLFRSYRAIRICIVFRSGTAAYREPHDLDSGVCKCKPIFLEWRSGSTKLDRKSTRLNSSHLVISYAVFCLQKKMRRFASAHPTLLVVT